MTNLALWEEWQEITSITAINEDENVLNCLYFFLAFVDTFMFQFLLKTNNIVGLTK